VAYTLDPEGRTLGPMLVYMLLNLVTEKVYIGATAKTLDERWKRHRESVAAGSQYPVHVAMAEWEDCCWERTVLQNCYSVEELDAAEEVWRDYCNALDPAVGYNRPAPKWSASVANGKITKKEVTAEKPVKKVHDKDFYRQCGKKGGRKRADMSIEELEQFRAWGKMGATGGSRTLIVRS